MAKRSRRVSKGTKNNGRSNRKHMNDNYKNSIAENEVDVTGKNLPAHNDPSWYKFDETMFHGVIQMPTLEFKGKNILWKESDASEVQVTLPDNFIKPPLVAAYYMNPSAGPGNAPQDSPAQYNKSY